MLAVLPTDVNGRPERESTDELSRRVDKTEFSGNPPFGRHDLRETWSSPDTLAELPWRKVEAITADVSSCASSDCAETPSFFCARQPLCSEHFTTRAGGHASSLTVLSPAPFGLAPALTSSQTTTAARILNTQPREKAATFIEWQADAERCSLPVDKVSEDATQESPAQDPSLSTV